MHYDAIVAAIDNQPIRRYLELMKNTEFPAVFNAWSVLGCGSAALSRHAWFDFKIEKIYPNLYIILTGTPGSRKSQSLKAVVNLLNEATSDIRFAPDDTAGKPQGLVARMTQPLKTEKAKPSLEQLISLDCSLEEMTEACYPRLDTDKFYMFLANPELGTSMNGAGADLIRFLSVMWDGGTYTYQLKKSCQELKKGLMSILGATTPEDLSKFMPLEATGQGFPSRVIFVYGERQQKIPWPDKDDAKFTFLIDTYKWMNEEAVGEFKMTPEAYAFTGALYQEFNPVIKDIRFTYYMERRHTHLLKLTMVFAALEKRMIIELKDVESAHNLLALAEDFMPDALGDYGLAPLSRAKQDLLMYVRVAKAPIPIKALWAMMRRDIPKERDFQETVRLYETEGKLVKVSIPGIGVCYKTPGTAQTGKQDGEFLSELFGSDGFNSQLD